MNAHDSVQMTVGPDQPLARLSACARPVFLMNAPFSLNHDQPNNATMCSLSADERRLNLDRAMAQFHELYSFVAQRSIVYLLPSVPGLPDQTFASNVAAFLPHRSDETIVLSNFRSKPRLGEDAAARPFLEAMGYNVVVSPHFFEGEADLKHLHGDTYIGACGMRTSAAALTWMSERFDMNILPVTIHDPQAYHLDCVVFPVDAENTLVCRALVPADQFKQIEAQTNIIDVDYRTALAMATNCLRIGQALLAQTNISIHDQSSSAYQDEVTKADFLESVAGRFGLDLALIDLSEFRKSGAALSCFLAKLNRAAFPR